MGRNQHGTERHFDSVIESAFVAAFAVERDQRRQIGLRHASAESAPAQGVQDLSRAGFFLGWRGRFASEDSLPACRISGSRNVIGSGNRHFVDFATALAFGYLVKLETRPVKPQVEAPRRTG